MNKAFIINRILAYIVFTVTLVGTLFIAEYLTPIQATQIEIILAWIPALMFTISGVAVGSFIIGYSGELDD